MFVDELVKHIQSGEPTERWDQIGQLDLDKVLWSRIQRQPAEARRLLGSAAVSGQPIRQALAFQATELWHRALLRLRGLRFRLRDQQPGLRIGSDPDRRLLVGRGGTLHD